MVHNGAILVCSPNEKILIGYIDVDDGDQMCCWQFLDQENLVTLTMFWLMKSCLKLFVQAMSDI